MKYLQTLDLSAFDVIDLDAYGIPFGQLEILFTRHYHGKVFVTFIQNVYGMLPLDFLQMLGYSHIMVLKCPTLFTRNGFQKFCDYLALHSIEILYFYEVAKKYYGVFSC